MTVSITERLESAEKDINRILEELQATITVEEASQQTQIADSDAEAILYRINRLEQRITALRHKWEIANKRSSL